MTNSSGQATTGQNDTDGDCCGTDGATAKKEQMNSDGGACHPEPDEKTKSTGRPDKGRMEGKAGEPGKKYPPVKP